MLVVLLQRETTKNHRKYAYVEVFGAWKCIGGPPLTLLTTAFDPQLAEEGLDGAGCFVDFP